METPIFDNNLFLRTTGAGSLTETVTTAGVAIKGTPVKGMACVVGLPKKSVGDTVRVKLQHSSNNSTFTDLVSFETVASVTVADTVSEVFVRRFATELKYVRAELTVAGTSPDFGAVWVAIGDQDNWNTLGVGQNSVPGSDTSL